MIMNAKAATIIHLDIKIQIIIHVCVLGITMMMELKMMFAKHAIILASIVQDLQLIAQAVIPLIKEP